MKNLIRICAVIFALTASASSHAETLLQQYQIENSTVQLTDENLIVDGQVVRVADRREVSMLIVKEIFIRRADVLFSGLRPACHGIVQSHTTFKFKLALDAYAYAESSIRLCDDTIELKREDGSEEIVAVPDLTVQKLQEILQNVGIQLQ